MMQTRFKNRIYRKKTFAAETELLQKPAQPPRALKLMSYNIHSGIGRDKRYRLDRTLAVLEAEKPDILALQEVDRNLSRSHFDDQSQIIAEALGMHHHHCVNQNIGDGEYGITTFSRFPILNRERHDLSVRSRIFGPRGTLRTTCSWMRPPSCTCSTCTWACGCGNATTSAAGYSANRFCWMKPCRIR